MSIKNTVDIKRPAMGTIPGAKGVTFRVWAPHAQKVYVTGTFNNWSKTSMPLAAEKNGCWSTNVSEAKTGDEYRYLVHDPKGPLSRIDPYARKVTGPTGNGVVYDPKAFAWGDNKFHMATGNELVIYEMHIGTFNAKEKGRPGTFESAIEKFPYLKKLGINAVEVMPIMEFSGDFSWGYDPAHPFAVESIYGGPDGFKRFVKAAHTHGIAVIVDVVYNHFGPSDLDLWQFDGWSENGKGGIYFYNDHRSHTPWGETRPDYGRDEVRQYIRDNAFMWLEEYHADGLRWDMTIANGHARVPEEIWPGNAKSWFSRKRSSLGTALVFTSPGIPMIFEGQELLEDRFFQDKVPIDWSRAENGRSILEMYRDMIALRRNLSDVTRGLCGQNISIYHFNDGAKIMAFHRWDKQGPADSVVVAVNMANQSHDGYVIGFPHAGLWKTRFNGDSKNYGPDFAGHPAHDVNTLEEKADGLPCSGKINIGPYTVVIFSQDK